ncbi:MAG: hypothetical protein WAM30_21610 [Candidatus Dormiibacterota bacterium]
MEPWLRRVTLLAMGGIVAAGALVAARNLPGPHVLVSGSGLGHLAVSIPVFTGCLVVQVLAWSFLLAAAAHAHWALRAVALVIWSAAMLFVSLAGISNSPSSFLVVGATLLVVIVVWQLAIGVWVLDRFHPAMAGRTHRDRLHLATGAGCLVATTLVYVLAWQSDPSLARFALPLSILLFGLQATFLIPVLFLTGSDFAEWGEVVAGRIGTAVARSPRALAALAGIVSVVVLGDAVRISAGPLGLLGEVIGMVLLAGITLALRRLLLPAPATEIPLGSLIPAGLAWFAVSYYWAVPIAFMGVRLSPLLWLWQVPIAALLVVAALRFRRLAMAALLFGVLTAETVLGSLHGIAAELGLGDRFVSLNDGIRILPAVACLGVLGWLAVRRRFSSRASELLRLVFVLTVAMQVLEWVEDGFQAAAEHGASISAVQGLLLVAAMFWDVAMSGAAITNRHGPRVPRHARVLLYCSYTLLGSSTVAFSALFPSSGFDSEGWVKTGVQGLGPALLLCFFAFGVARWWPHRDEAGSAPGAREPSGRGELLATDEAEP